MDLTALVTRMETARRTYYNNSGELVISDAEYDALENELRQIDPNHPLLKTVGSNPLNGSWPKVRHQMPMGSLNKGQVKADIESWYNGTSRNALCVSEKLDGASLSLIYKGRKLVQAITRGDGTIGEDITKNVLLMKGIVKMLPATLNGVATPDTVYVRGEIICLKSDFDTHFIGESNPRNTASGTAKRQTDNGKCAYLTFKAYNLMPNGTTMKDKGTELSILKNTIGFSTPNFMLCPTLAEVDALYNEYIKTVRNGLDYLIDGLVIDIDNGSVREGLGETGGYPKGSVAFKFPHEQKPTVLKNIRWQVGNSGRITPVAEFDSVNLAGANVAQASLHNISNIAEIVSSVFKGETLFRVNDKILVSRRNDVIPFVEAILTRTGNEPAFPIPTTCPSCKSPLTRDGEYLVCRNAECEAQASGAIKRWISKIGILHFGDTMIETIVEEGMVQDIADLYLLDPAKVADLNMHGRKIGGSADKAIKNLHDKKTLPLHVLVGSLGIPLIGRSMAKMVVDAGFNSLSKMLKAKISEIAVIPGMGQTKAEAFVTGFQKKVGLISKLLANGIQIQVVSGSFVGLSMCQTGFRDQQMSDTFERQGGSVKGGVSKGLTYLVCLDKTSSSGKMSKAVQYGVKVVEVEEMWVILGGRP